MSMEKFVLVAVVSVAALLALAGGMPSPGARELSSVLNRTVCPIRVAVDEDPKRVPRRIKLLKCAASPTHWCRHQGIPDNECCSHSHNERVMQCVEIVDTVLVHYPASNTTTTYTVEVGCTCLISHARSAITAT